MNIPVHHLQEVKDNKQTFELFAVAVLFKIMFPNSIVGNVDNKRLRNLLHCKHNVAQRILEGMYTSRFFCVSQQGKVFVPSLKSTEMRTFGRRKRRYESESDYCKKLRIGNYTLREIKRILRELLLENMVHIKDVKQVQRSGDSEKYCATLLRDDTITYKQFSSGFGLSRSSAHRYINNMVDSGKVSKTQTVAECVIPILNDVTMKEWMWENRKKTPFALRSHHGWSGWVCFGNVYHIMDRDVSESFKHIIWRHEDRLGTLIPKKGDVPDGERYWSKHR